MRLTVAIVLAAFLLIGIAEAQSTPEDVDDQLAVTTEVPAPEVPVDEVPSTEEPAPEGKLLRSSCNWEECTQKGPGCRCCGFTGKCTC